MLYSKSSWLQGHKASTYIIHLHNRTIGGQFDTRSQISYSLGHRKYVAKAHIELCK